VGEYVLDVKGSARRTNGAVGAAVNRGGPRRRFPARADAEAWARGLSVDGDCRVWVRAANPDDGTGADGYLIGRRRPAPAGAPGDGGTAGAEQATLPGVTGRR
jgi:hypothetical protein